MTRHKPNLILMAASITAVLLALAGALSAGKPSGGGGGGAIAAGTVTFWANGRWIMNADGTGKQPTSLWSRSHTLHGGYVWELTIRTHSDTGFNELAIVREDDDPNTTVYTGIPEMSLLNFRWAKDDSFISFSGGPDLSTVGSEMGIYAATLDWSGGAPVLTSAFMPIVTGTVTAANNDPQGDILPWFDWSPDGSGLVYIRWDGYWGIPMPILFVRDLMSGQETILAVTVHAPTWSPDGTRIAVRLEDSASTLSGIYTIKPDGWGLTQLTSEGQSRDQGPIWSPDSQFIIFSRSKIKAVTGVLEGDLFRIPSTGGRAVNLTSDMPNSHKATGDWR